MKSKKTILILKSKKGNIKVRYLINQDIHYLINAIEEYAEREGWDIK